MEKPLNIFKPTRRTCPGKTVKYPITQLKPESWLNNSGETFTFSSLDGYVIDKSGKVTAFMDRFEFDGSYEDRHNFVKSLLDRFGNEIRTNLKLATQLNIPYRVFLWSKDFPHKDELHERKIIVFLPELINNEVDLSHAKWINLKGLEAGIKKYRGRSYNAVKSLKSANSNVECYLANQTKNPWPGDIDGLIVDKSSGLVKSIIEFKTHNIDSPIEEQFIGKYGKQDWRRFEVLYSLQDSIQSALGHRPKLFYMVWGTGDYTNHRHLKIDEIVNGQSVNSTTFVRPEFGAFSPELFDILCN